MLLPIHVGPWDGCAKQRFYFDYLFEDLYYYYHYYFLLEFDDHEDLVSSIVGPQTMPLVSFAYRQFLFFEVGLHWGLALRDFS